MLVIAEAAQLAHPSAATAIRLREPIGGLNEFRRSRGFGYVRKYSPHLAGIEGEIVLDPTRREARPFWPIFPLYDLSNSFALSVAASLNSPRPQEGS